MATGLEAKNMYEHRIEDYHRIGPPIVCLCGSTKFKAAFEEAAKRETLGGRIVVSVGFFAHQPGERYQLTKTEKSFLDNLHLRKIELADEVVILNVGGYVGASTRREAWYAYAQEKDVRWLEPVLIAHPAPSGHELTPPEIRAVVLAWFPTWDAWREAATDAANV